jgi:hypothetical protein
MTRLLLVCVAVAAMVAAYFYTSANKSDGAGGEAVPLSAAQQSAVDSLSAIAGVVVQTEAGQVVGVRGGGKIDDQSAATLAELKTIRSLKLEACPLTADGIAKLTGIDDLERLALDGVEITADGLQQLQSAPKLRELSLATCQLSDDALDALGKMSSIESLDLSQTNISDAGLERLTGLTGLRRLYLNKTEVTGSGLLAMPSRDQWELLNLSGAPVGAALIECLGDMASLTTLYLDNTPIDDAMAGELVPALVQGAPNLQGLFLDGTQLTDAAVPALKQLAEMQQLAAVRLAGTQITRPVYDELAKAASEIRFAYGGGGVEED